MREELARQVPVRRMMISVVQSPGKSVLALWDQTPSGQQCLPAKPARRKSLRTFVLGSQAAGEDHLSVVSSCLSRTPRLAMTKYTAGHCVKVFRAFRKSLMDSGLLGGRHASGLRELGRNTLSHP